MIHPKCAGFASLLIDACNSQILYQTMCRRRNEPIANWKEIIFNKSQLRLNFDNCHSIKNFSKEAKAYLDEGIKFICLKHFIQD